MPQLETRGSSAPAASAQLSTRRGHVAARFGPRISRVAPRRWYQIRPVSGTPRALPTVAGRNRRSAAVVDRMQPEGAPPRSHPRQPDESDSAAPPRPVSGASRHRHSQSDDSTGVGQRHSAAQRRRRRGFRRCCLRTLPHAVLLWALCQQSFQPAVAQPVGNSISSTSVVSTSSFFASSLAAGPPYNTMLIITGAQARRFVM